jgi:hypothetical protein
MTSIAGSEKTEVVYGTSNVLNTEIQFFSNADTCMDYTGPSLALRIESISKSFLDARGRDAVIHSLHCLLYHKNHFSTTLIAYEF